MKRKHEKSSNAERSISSKPEMSIYSEAYWKEIDAFELPIEEISEHKLNKQTRTNSEPLDDCVFDERITPKQVRLKETTTVESLRKIPQHIHIASIDGYVSSKVTAELPAHIETVYVKPGANLTAVSSLPATVKNIKYRGEHILLAERGEHQSKTNISASKENIGVWNSRGIILPKNIKAEEVKKLPLHVNFVGLNNGVSPEVTSALHSCVNRVGITKNVDPESLKALPKTVNKVILHRQVTKEQVSALGPNVKEAVLASPGIPGGTRRELSNKNVATYHTKPSYIEYRLFKQAKHAAQQAEQSDKENTPKTNNNSNNTPFK